MLSSDVMRGFNGLIILSLLSKGDSYGYQISQSIRHFTNEQYVMKETTLYSAFNRLEKQGLIESYPSRKTHGKPRTYYRITPVGQQVLKDKTEEWQLTKQIIDQLIKGEEA